MNIYPRGGVYYVDFEDATGKRRRISTKQRDEKLARVKAAEILHTHLVDNLDTEQREAIGTHLTVAFILSRAYEERWKKQRGARERLYQVRQMSKRVGHWGITTVTFSRLKDLAAELEREGNKPATINRKFSLLKTALRDCADRGEITGIPKFPFFNEDNEIERYVSREEEQQILAWFADNVPPADTTGNYFRDLFIVLIDTGLRTSEGCGLLPERIVEGGTAIRLPKGRKAESRLDRTKSGKSRTVPLTTRAQAAVQRLLANPVHRNFPESTNWASLRFGRYMDRVGLPDIGLHTLRHTCASRLVQGGEQLLVVKEWLGHANLRTTERYAHLAPSNLRSAVSVLEGTAAPSTSTPPPSTVPPHAVTIPQAEAQEGGNVTLFRRISK